MLLNVIVQQKNVRKMLIFVCSRKSSYGGSEKGFLKSWYFCSPLQGSTVRLSKIVPHSNHSILCSSYTMRCPPVRGDNPRALASGLSYVQVNKHGITILYHLHQCRPCTSSDISC